MKILNINQASDAIKQAYQKLETAFDTCSQDSSAANLNGFTVAANELAHIVTSEGYTHLLMDTKNRLLISSARERTPRAQLFITDAADAKEQTETSAPQGDTENLVQIYHKGPDEDIRYISLKKWSNQFYLEEPDFQSADYKDFSADEVTWLLQNMKLAFTLFLGEDETASLSVLSTTAEHIICGRADCILMPVPPRYRYDDDDELVRFCRFIGNNKPFGFTVCHQKPVKRNQPEYCPESDSFSFPHRGTANLAVASTIPPESFTDGHEDRYKDVTQLVMEVLGEYINNSHVSSRSLGELLSLSLDYAREDGSQKELSFSSIKVGKRIFDKLFATSENDDAKSQGTDADYALIIESLVNDMKSGYADFPIRFKYHSPDDNQ